MVGFDSPKEYKILFMVSYQLTKEIKEDKTLKYFYFIDKNHPLANKSGKVYYHRHLISLSLNRWIKSNEIVHHINGNKQDNTLTNLQLMNSSDHRKLHCIELGYSTSKEITCPICNNKFITLENEYCSKSCASNSRFGNLKNITNTELENLIKRMPITKIAKLYNVSDSAIIKKCKKLNIIRPGRGYWEKYYHKNIQ